MWFIKTQEVSRRGTPDFLICANGKFIAWEIKKDAKSRLDALQYFNLLAIDKANGWGRVVCPENYDVHLNELKGVL